MKYSNEALAAAGRYSSRAASICRLVPRASVTLDSISAAVRLVVSKFSTRDVSSRTLLPADDSLK